MPRPKYNGKIAVTEKLIMCLQCGLFPPELAREVFEAVNEPPPRWRVIRRLRWRRSMKRLLRWADQP